MAKIQFQILWDNHPGTAFVCDKTLFPNQCAMRMGVALEKSHVNMRSFDIKFPQRRCYPGLKHSPAHILAAQQLADWLVTQPALFGSVIKRKKAISGDFGGKKGIVFIMNGWGQTDHIDLWNGQVMRAGQADYFALGKEVWFWELK